VDLLLLLVTVCLSYSLDGVCLVVVSDLIWIALTSLPRQALTAFCHFVNLEQLLPHFIDYAKHDEALKQRICKVTVLSASSVS